MIYIVEDDSSIRELEQYALQSNGYETTGCEDAASFWAALRSGRPDLVILDVMLPDEDGYQILAKLRADPACAATPVIMVTAKTSEIDVVKGLDHGADDYLCKPFGIMEFISRVRAVLRRAAAYDLTVEHYSNETERLCVEYSVSPQIAGLLQTRCPDQCEDILKASFTPPPLCVRVNTLQTDIGALEEEFARQGMATRRGAVPDSLYVECRGDVTALKLFKQGLFHVQGEASQLACAALSPRPGDTVLDLCAAPGGKSATLAQYMENKGTLVSCDAAQNRLTLVGGALERLGVACGRVLHNDAAVYNEAFAGADAVLCDVPCSGLGVLAKKPDIRQKTLDGLDGLVRLQRAILETAARYVRPGGRLVYSTCTLNPDENAGIVRPFLKEHPEFRTRSVECVLPGTTKDDDFLTLYPFRTGTDGFFIASLERL